MAVGGGGMWWRWGWEGGACDGGGSNGLRFSAWNFRDTVPLGDGQEMRSERERETVLFLLKIQQYLERCL